MIDKIGTTHPEKLENISAKIDELIEKFESNENLTEEEIDIESLLGA